MKTPCTAIGTGRCRFGQRRSTAADWSRWFSVRRFPQGRAVGKTACRCSAIPVAATRVTLDPLPPGGQRVVCIRDRGGSLSHQCSKTASRIAGRPASRRAEPHGAASGRGPEQARAACLRRTAMPQGVARQAISRRPDPRSFANEVAQGSLSAGLQISGAEPKRTSARLSGADRTIASGEATRSSNLEEDI